MDVKKVAEDLEVCKTEVGREMQLISNDVSAFRDEMTELKQSVAQLITIFEAGQGALKVMGWLGVAVKWMIVVGGGFAAIWYWLHGGKH